MRWTEAQYQEYLRKKGQKIEKPMAKKQKYRNKGEQGSKEKKQVFNYFPENN